MTTIKASSPCCGEGLELAPTDVRVVVRPAHEEEVRSFYTYRCPGMTIDGARIPCGNQINKPAPLDVIALLRTGGVRVIVVEPEQHEGDALTEDDLIGLGCAIEACGDLAGVAQREREASA